MVELAEIYRKKLNISEDDAMEKANYFIASLGISHEDFLLSQASELDLDTEGFVGVDSDIKKKLNIIRKGGTSFLIGNFLAKKTLQVINTNIEKISTNELLFLLKSLKKELKFIDDNWEKRNYLKFSYFSLKYFELNLSEDKHEEIREYLNHIWKLVIISNIITKLLVRGNSPIRQEKFEFLNDDKMLIFEELLNFEYYKTLSEIEF